jgi:hypothetical protein
MVAADEYDWSRKVNKVREILTKPGERIKAHILFESKRGKIKNTKYDKK